MVNEHCRNIGFREALVAAQGFEHVRHGVRVIARAGEEADPDAIGLRFIVTREIDLLLRGKSGGSSDAALVASAGLGH